MDFIELSDFLPTLTIRALKDICNTNRLWGVYQSRPSISGYSKCKNKQELVTHILKHFEYYTKKHFGDNECPNYYGWIQKEIDFIYNGQTIDMKTLKIEYLGSDVKNG